jgi:hypothetical protein
MVKCQRFWWIASARVLAIYPAIFDGPTGHTSWEVMRRLSGGMSRGTGTYFAERHLFFLNF